MLIHDAAAATSRTLTPEGFLRVKARIARAGLHSYQAHELGTPSGFSANDTITVFRPPDAVFDPDAMASFAAKPVTDDHPPAMVDAGNWKRYAVGHTGPEVTREGDHLAADLLITDAVAVARAEAGAQLSNGYLADFEFTPGTTPDGEPFHAIQSNIRGNHIALVDAGRCGDSCRIGDAAVTDCGGGTPALVTVLLDGVAVETTASGAATLERLRQSLEARDGTVAALEAAVPDAAALDRMVAERALVIDAARLTLGSGFAVGGRSTAEIRRAVVAAALGRDMGGRSDAYVAAAFDTLAATRAPPNPLATHLAAASRDVCRGPDAARQTRDRFLTDAWKGDRTPGAS